MSSSECTLVFDPTEFQKDMSELRATIVVPASHNEQENKEWEKLVESIFGCMESNTRFRGPLDRKLPIFKFRKNLVVIVRLTLFRVGDIDHYIAAKLAMENSFSQLKRTIEARDSN